MSAKNISIINSPAATHGDASVTNGVMSITGLTPFKTGTLQALRVTRNQAETPSIWVVTLVAGVAGTLSFNMQQTVNSMLKSLGFSMPNTTATVATNVISAINGFFGGAATDGGGFVSASSASGFEIQYSVAVSSLTTTLTIKGATGNPIVGVTATSDTTVTVATGMASLALTTQANTDGAAVIFKTTAAHGLVTGSTLAVGALGGQVAANNAVWRVIYLSTTTFNLVDPITLSPILATGTGSATGAAGTLTIVAQADFGSVAYVNNDAQLNGSSQVVTATTMSFSAVDIVPQYTDENAPVANTRIAPCRVWIPEALAASPYTASTNGQALTAFLDGYLV